jgi:Flp pilus assembly protein TadG
MTRRPLSRFVSRIRSNRRGAAIVEFAVVVPLFFTLVMGIIEFGRIFMVQEMLVNAARVGARAAILSGSTQSGVQSIISNYMSSTGVSGYTSTISPNLSGSPAPGSGTAISVTVSVPWSSITWSGTYPINLTGTTLTSTVVMIHE